MLTFNKENKSCPTRRKVLLLTCTVIIVVFCTRSIGGKRMNRCILNSSSIANQKAFTVPTLLCAMRLGLGLRSDIYTDGPCRESAGSTEPVRLGHKLYQQYNIRHLCRPVLARFESRAPESRFFEDLESLLDSPVTKSLSSGSVCLTYSDTLSWRGNRSRASRKAEPLLELELLLVSKTLDPNSMG